MTTTISLLNMKGGVGKTTLAVNLAWYLHQSGPFNVLLIDLDPQFNATQYVMDYKTFEDHRKKRGTIADLLVSQPKFELKTIHKKVKNNPLSALHTIKKTGTYKLDILPAELRLSAIVKNPSQMEFRLEKLLEKIRGGYDYVIVDCAPTDSVLTTMALTASDQLLIPVRPDRFSILGLTNLLETVDAFRSNCHDPHHVQILGMVFTQVTNASDVETSIMTEVSNAAAKQGVYLFANNLRHSKSFIRSVNDQTPIFETLYAHEKSRAAVGKIADEMKTRLVAIAAKSKTKVKKK